ILIRVRRRRFWHRFISEISGRVATITMRGLSRKQLSALLGIEEFTCFWDDRPFTRVVDWGHDFIVVRNYVDVNELEAQGLIALRQKFGFSSRPPPK
ncbi:MAG: hypothetical protein N2578_06295, partial [Bdellovibrionaceae bacterium]|nr:hypothetical protein [Pseudobdellovibrionaceae bacterium]